MISPETEEKIAKVWLEQIPEQYRNCGHNRSSTHERDRFMSSAIILGLPPEPLLFKFFEMLSRRKHLTANQLRAREMRAKAGSAASQARKGKNGRARQQPSLPDYGGVQSLAASENF